MAQPSSHDFCSGKASIGKGLVMLGRDASVSRLPVIGATAETLKTTNRVQLFIFNWNNLMVF